MNFKSIYGHGFVRLAACSPRLAVADPTSNVKAILSQASECHQRGVAAGKVFRVSQFKRSAMPNGPKVTADGSFRRELTGERHHTAMRPLG